VSARTNVETDKACSCSAEYPSNDAAAAFPVNTRPSTATSKAGVSVEATSETPVRGATARGGLSDIAEVEGP
jgi:hypothetical protein